MIIFARKLLPAFIALLLAVSLATTALAQDATPSATPIPLATNTPDVPQEVAVPEVTPSVTEIPATLNNVEQLEYGTTVDGELSANAPSVIYSFAASAGDIVAVEMTSSDLDAYLQFGDAQGNPLAAADEGAGGLNARLGPIQIPADGSYLVVAESFSYGLAIGRKVETGKYKLTVEKYDLEAIDYPGQAEGTLSVDAPLAVYRISAQAGEVVVAKMRSEDVDSLLILEQASKVGGFVTRNDDFGAGANAQIGPYIIPESGDYLLTATSATSNAQGSYKLSIEKLASSPIAYGDKLDDELSDDDPALVYTFAGAIGDLVSMAVTGEGELDTTMTLLGPDGAQVAFNDETNGHNPAISDLQLPADGTYTLVIQPFVAGKYGNFHFEIVKG